LPFLNETTDFDAVWTIIELNLWEIGWWKKTLTLLHRHCTIQGEKEARAKKW